MTHKLIKIIVTYTMYNALYWRARPYVGEGGGAVRELKCLH